MERKSSQQTHIFWIRETITSFADHPRNNNSFADKSAKQSNSFADVGKQLILRERIAGAQSRLSWYVSGPCRTTLYGTSKQLKHVENCAHVQRGVWRELKNR